MTWEYYLREILPYWIYITKGYGISIQKINESCPADLAPYERAHKLELQEMDTYAHVACGSYILSAVSTAIEHNLAGRNKAKSKYVDEPIFSKVFENDGLTEEEIYEKELKKAIAVENQCIALAEARGLPKTKIL